MIDTSDQYAKRFIPACAGNAKSPLWMCSPQAVHPRMRGERHCCRYRFPVVTGSSPHARGTRTLRDFPSEHLRFIPACAGNAFPAMLEKYLSTVHPRMRGERALLTYMARQERGSSPHARGTLFQVLRLQLL